MTQKTVSRLLELSKRQARRLVKTVRENGDSGIMHGSRGRPSNHRLSEAVKAPHDTSKYHDEMIMVMSICP